MTFTRRSLFSLLGALPFLALVPKAKRYGPVDVNRWCCLYRQGTDLHVFYQGQDVTSRCFFVDDAGIGTAELYLVNQDGRKYRGDDGEIAKEVVRGVTVKAVPRRAV